MGQIFDSVVKFLREDDWKFQQAQGPKGQPLLWMDVNGRNGQLRCVADVEEERKQVLFYSFFPEKVPENKRREVAEFIARANYGLWIGNFELDMRDGEVRYKTSIDVEDAPLTSLEMKQLVYISVGMADKFRPGLMALIYGNVSPEQAVAQVQA